MLRGSMQKQSKCQQHDFRLYPSSQAIYNGQYYNVSFCTCKHDKPNKKYTKTYKYNKNLTFPHFNHDNNYSTPAFILNSERNYYESEGTKMKADHQKKMEDYTQSKLQINIPKPRSKNNYCSVCKNNYEDYLDHIQGELHRRKIHLSTFNKDILELSQKYQKDSQKKTRRGAINHGEKTVSATRIEDSDEVQIISNPYKQVKPNETANSLAQVQLMQMQQSYLNNLNRANQCPAFSPIGPFVMPLNSAPLNSTVGSFNTAFNSMSTSLNTFRPFSSTYQQQMNQFILNLNVILNPYAVNPMLPPMGLPSPFELALQAKQQLNMLQYSLMNQISSCNQMQNSLINSVAQPTCIVIDQ